MSAPNNIDWPRQHRICRYLVGKPRMIIEFKWQNEPSTVTGYTDSDWAGCAKTARSTSGGIIAIGDHILKTYSKQQKTVALSSAEAELYAMVSVSAEALAIIAYASDLGIELQGEIHTDSSAALGISQRAGIGKVRHLRTQGLWVQECRITGRLKYHKVLGTKNPSDILTKYVNGDLLERHVESLGVRFEGGRAETAPEMNSVESWTAEIEWETQLNDEKDAKVKRVSFAKTVKMRAVPSQNRGIKPGKKSRAAQTGRGRMAEQTQSPKRLAAA